MLGEQIAANRIKCKMSQEDLAKELYVVRQTISKWERNISTPDANQLVKLAEIFNISMEELCGNENFQKDATPSDKSKKNRIPVYLPIIFAILLICILSIITVGLYSNWVSSNPDTHIEDIQDDKTTLILMNNDLELSIELVDFQFDGEYTTGKIKYSWHWNKIPTAKNQDELFVYWNDWIITDNFIEINYYDLASNQLNNTYSSSIDTTSNNRFYEHKIDLLSDGSFALEGSGEIHVRSTIHAKNDFVYYISYGHNYLGRQIEINDSNFRKFSFGALNIGSISGTFAIN